MSGLLGGPLSSPLSSQVVPQPQKIEIGQAVCTGDSIHCDSAEFAPQVEAFVTALGALGVRGVEHKAAASKNDVIRIEQGKIGNDGRYRIVTKNGVLVVTAESTVALAHAMATLLQLVRVSDGRAEWSTVQIMDVPDQPFRCFMVDMGRNPHDPTTLRSTLR